MNGWPAKHGLVVSVRMLRPWRSWNCRHTETRQRRLMHCATGTLPPAQAAAAEQVAGAFWSALGRNDPAAVAQTVLPAQRRCVRSVLTGGPRITVTSLRVVSAQPAGNGRATIRFTVKARASLGWAHHPGVSSGAGPRAMAGDGRNSRALVCRP